MRKETIQNFSEAKEYLDSFINYERNIKFSYTKTLKLQRVETLFNRLRIDRRALRVIHVAGTKGKGSVAHFCACLLAATGFRVGLYTSPHLFDFRERIAIQESLSYRRYASAVRTVLISKKDVVRILRSMQPEIERMRYDKTLGILSFFEVYTALAIKYFIEKKLDFVVLETGLGGRLDATNIIAPICSVITHIGYDHTDKLGTSLACIAAEKAGIIKKKIPVVVAFQRPVVSRVIRNYSIKQKAPTFIFNRDFKAAKIRIAKDSTTFNFSFNPLRRNSRALGHSLKVISKSCPAGLGRIIPTGIVRGNFTNFGLENMKISLRGKYQVENASLAIAAIMVLQQKGYIKNAISWRKGLNGTFVPGRFETLKKNPLIIADVAHNPLAFAALAENLKLYFPTKKVILIFAASRDKDIRHMLDKIKYKELILTSFHNPRAFTPLEIRDICHKSNAYLTGDIKEALAIAKKIYTRNQLIIISGSLFLVSEAKQIFCKNHSLV